MWVLLAEVNLRVIGFSSMSLMMLQLRKGGAPPRDLESWCALAIQVLCSVCVGRVEVILFELSREIRAFVLMTSLEKVIRRCSCGWSVKVKRRV